MTRKDIEKRNIEGRYEHKTVRTPSASATDPDRKEKGIQERGEVESEAQERVSGYCVAFHWDHCTEEAFDAAIAAEIKEVGSGRAVIDAATQNAWQAKRKGKGQ